MKVVTVNKKCTKRREISIIRSKITIGHKITMTKKSIKMGKCNTTPHPNTGIHTTSYNFMFTWVPHEPLKVVMQLIELSA